LIYVGVTVASGLFEGRHHEHGRRPLVPTTILLITLRNAQVRRISWVRGVRPARERCEWPPQWHRFRPATISCAYHRLFYHCACRCVGRQPTGTRRRRSMSDESCGARSA